MEHLIPNTDNMNGYIRRKWIPVVGGSSSDPHATVCAGVLGARVLLDCSALGGSNNNETFLYIIDQRTCKERIIAEGGGGGGAANRKGFPWKAIPMVAASQCGYHYCSLARGVHDGVGRLFVLVFFFVLRLSCSCGCVCGIGLGLRTVRFALRYPLFNLSA